MYVAYRVNCRTYRDSGGVMATYANPGSRANPNSNRGQETSWKASVDRYHCHILEHEDHDMMRPFVVMPFELMPFM